MNRRSFIFVLLATLLLAIPAGASRRWIPKPVAATGAWYVVSGKTCVAAYQPKGAASLAASYVNLANPGTNDAAPGTAPTLGADGWAFVTASSQYLDTGVIPANGYTMIVRCSNWLDTGGTQWMCGVDSASDAKFYLCPEFTTAQRIYGSGQFVLTAGPALGSPCVMAIAGQQPYYDGVADGSTVGAWGAAQTRSIFIGADQQNGGGAGFYWTGHIQAMAIYSGTLTAGEISALTTRMNAL